MKYMPFISIISLLGLILSASNVYAQKDCIVKQENLVRHVYTLASDSMAGRKTGEMGLRIAAEYIAGEFKEAGLIPFASDSSYFQTFSLYMSVDHRIEFTGIHKKVSSFAVASNYLNPTDTMVMVFNDPRSPMPSSVINDNKTFLLLNPENQKQAGKVVRKRHGEGIRRFIIIADGPAWEYQLLRNEMPDRSYRLKSKNSNSGLEKVIKGLDSLVVVIMRPQEIAQIIGYKPDFDMLEEEVRKNRALIRIGAPTTFQYLPGRIDSIMTENIAGMVKGERGNDQVVVITAHYDHVGTDRKGLNAGADDNASGTAALVEIARVLKCLQDSGAVFKGSVLFVAFSAEEAGLLGSEFFVMSKEFATVKPLLNMNLDMIGRSVKYGFIETFRLQSTGYTEDLSRRESYVYLMNKGKGTRRYVRYAERAAKYHPGFNIDRSPGLIERVTFRYGSDHANFIKKKIPVLVWFTGLHPDYHTPGDTPDKIDYDNMAKITCVIIKATTEIITR